MLVYGKCKCCHADVVCLCERGYEIEKIMLLNNDSRANKLHEITNCNIILSLFVNENIKFFNNCKSYKYKFVTVTYDYH